ncbi:hypothetical protein BSL78_27556, partial [Apostichopus japonicus]
MENLGKLSCSALSLTELERTSTEKQQGDFGFIDSCCGYNHNCSTSNSGGFGRLYESVKLPKESEENCGRRK